MISFKKVLSKLNKLDILLLGIYSWSFIFSSFIFRESQKNALFSRQLAESLEIESIFQFLPAVSLSLLGMFLGIYINKKKFSPFNSNEKKPSNMGFYICLPLLIFIYQGFLGSFFIGVLSKIPLIYSIYNLYLNRIKGLDKYTYIFSYIVITIYFTRYISQIAFAPLIWIILPLWIAFSYFGKNKSSFRFINVLNLKFLVKSFLTLIVISLILVFLSIKGVLRDELWSDENFGYTNILEWVPYINLESISEGIVGQTLGRTNMSTILGVVIRQPIDDNSLYVEHALTSIIPRILLPNKMLNNIGNTFGHDFNLLDPTDFSTSLNLPFLIQNYMIFGSILIFIPFLVIGLLFSNCLQKIDIALKTGKMLQPSEFISSNYFFVAMFLSFQDSYSAVSSAIFGYYFIKLIFLILRFLLPQNTILNSNL